ncbi:alpha-tocopherol transfer protein-like [Bacillus rossius redtenbacheri]|uniref:alpha-tocopherol transfer protein-like n=1 Tax=Bacillus rossius redtenbacheri TaxID=93214 RepID=UPI002FDE2FD5
MSPLSLEEEYQNNPCLRREDISNLKEWLTQHPHLPAVPDEMLIMFLHACNYKTDATKHTVERHYSLKASAPEVWSNRDPSRPEVQRALQIIEMSALPSRDPDGNLVLVCRFAEPADPSRFVHAEAAKAYSMFHDLSVWRAGLVPGVVMVLDQKGANLSLVARLNLSVLRNHLAYLQDGFPGRIVNFHVVNCVSVTEKLLAIARPFLKSELLEKLRVHGSGMESLYKCVPREILPTEYGGEAGSFKDLHSKTIEEMKLHRDWFLEEEKLQINESKRLGTDKKSKGAFGIVGSFKKLDID